jgi:fatty acid desaturase
MITSAAVPVIPKPREQVLPERENFFKSLLAIALLTASFHTAGRLTAAVEAAGLAPAPTFALKWSAVLAMAIVSGIFVTALIGLAHEAIHRVMFRSRFWNEFWGGLLSALSLVPFYANRQFHLTHHGYAHQDGRDPENVMHNRPFVSAFAIGSFIALWGQYKIFLLNLLHVFDRKYTGRVAKDLFFGSVAAAFYFGVVPALGTPVSVSVVPMIIVFPLVFSFRALSDHYGIPGTAHDGAAREDILDAEAETWEADAEYRKREVSGWVVLTAPWLEWLWSGVNYHEVHHRYPHLSQRYLRRAFEATKDEHPYYAVNGYWRSFFGLRKLDYYSRPEEVRAHLTNRAPAAAAERPATNAPAG